MKDVREALKHYGPLKCSLCGGTLSLDTEDHIVNTNCKPDCPCRTRRYDLPTSDHCGSPAVGST